MDHDLLTDKQTSRLSSVIQYALPIVFQALLFFGAAAAIALFYLSYRPGHFLPSFIITGLLMAPPWFIVSVLPTLFGLRDRDLLHEILGSQLLCFLIVIATLAVLAFSTGFHPALFDRAVAWLLASIGYLRDVLDSVRSFVSELIAAVRTFLDETLIPLFSR